MFEDPYLVQEKMRLLAQLRKELNINYAQHKMYMDGAKRDPAGR